MSRSRELLMVCMLAVLAESLFRPLTSRAQTTSPQPADARTACAADVQKLCPGVQPGGGRILACLKQHKDQVSDGCKSAVMAAMQRSGGNSGFAPPSANAPSTGDQDSGSSSSASRAPTSEPPASDAPAAAPAAKPSRTASAKTKSASGAGSGSYLRMKKVQVIAKINDAAFGGNADIPALDMLIPSDWNLKGGVAGNTHEGCFSDIFALSWEATAPDGVLAFQGAPNDSWQYSDDPAELKNLNDPHRRALPTISPAIAERA